MASFQYQHNGIFGTGVLNRGPYATGGASSNIRTPRTRNFGHNGTTTNNATFHVANDFGMNRTGGYVMVAFHGWATDHVFGMIEWRNGGGSDGITSAYWRPFISDNGVTVSMSHDSDQTITMTLSSTHGNAHGWQWQIWGPK